MLEQRHTVDRRFARWSTGGSSGVEPDAVPWASPGCRVHGESDSEVALDNRHGRPIVDYVATMELASSIAGEQRAFAQACKGLAAAENVPELLASLVSSARDMVGADAAWLGLREGDELLLRAHSGLRHSDMSLVWRLPVGEGIGGHVAAERQSLVVRNFLRDPRRVDGVKSLVDAEGLRSGAVVPFGDQNECFGALYVGWHDRDRFDAAQLPTIEALARVGGQLYAGLHRRDAQSVQLERVLGERTVLDGAFALIGEISAVLVEDGDLEAAVTMLAIWLGGQAWVTDRQGNLLAGRAGSGDVTLDVPLGGTPAIGRLQVEGPEAPTGVERDTVAHVGRLLALELLRRRSSIATEMRIRTQVLDDLLDGQAGDRKGLMLQAAMIGVDLGVTRTVVAIAPVGVADGSAAALEPEQFERIEQMIVRAFPESMVTSRNGAAVAFLAVPDGEPGTLKKLGAAVAAVLAERSDLRSMIVGVGCLCRDLDDYARSAQEALLAPHYAAGRAGCGAVLTADDMGLYSLLGRSTDPHGLASIVSSALGPLIDADRETGSEYVKTLTAYFENDRHHDRTAAALHVHVNTLRYRLDRLRGILAVDFRNPHSRFILELAIRIRGAIGTTA